LLAERFEEVVATDASAAQIEKAQPHDRVTYRTVLAEESGLPTARLIAAFSAVGTRRLAPTGLPSVAM
jgi:hypothetical protein